LIIPLLDRAAKGFLAMWTGQIDIATPGTETFRSASDDGSVVYIDGNLVVNNNFSQGAPGNAPNGSFTFATPGLHTIEVDYFQGGGGGSEVLSWGLSHIAESFAFHFMRAFLVESPQMAPQKTGLFPTFGKMGKPLAVKR
jgi:hypothetical protein